MPVSCKDKYKNINLLNKNGTILPVCAEYRNKKFAKQLF